MENNNVNYDEMITDARRYFDLQRNKMRKRYITHYFQEEMN